MISITKKSSSKSNNLQVARFPELIHSIVYIPEKKQINPDFAPFEKPKIYQSDKIFLKTLLLDWSKETEMSFLSRIEKHNELTPYTYCKKLKGVLYKGKKYRFSRLEITKPYIENLTRLYSVSTLNVTEKSQEFLNQNI